MERFRGAQEVKREIFEAGSNGSVLLKGLMLN